MKKINHNILFWILNALGWFIYGTVPLIIYWIDGLPTNYDYFGFVITYILGFMSTSIMRYIYKRFDLTNTDIMSLVRKIILNSVLFAVIWYGSDVLITSYFVESFREYFSKLGPTSLIYRLFGKAVTILGWSSIYFGIKFWNEWVNQKLKAEEANSLAKSAQLQMLRYQLNPHFLFNSLNSIRALIDEDTRNAKNMITELSEFLRYSLISKNSSMVPLKQELKAVEHYFSIEKKRFEEKLDVKFNIDPLAEDYPVLSFLIHPLTENAVKYGMQTTRLPLRITIDAKVIEGKLKIAVCNSGKWVKEKEEFKTGDGTGTGLKNIRQRLENYLPGKYEFEIKELNELVCAEIIIDQVPEKKNEK